MNIANASTTSTGAAASAASPAPVRIGSRVRRASALPSAATTPSTPPAQASRPASIAISRRALPADSPPMPPDDRPDRVDEARQRAARDTGDDPGGLARAARLTIRQPRSARLAPRNRPAPVSRSARARPACSGRASRGSRCRIASASARAARNSSATAARSSGAAPPPTTRRARLLGPQEVAEPALRQVRLGQTEAVVQRGQLLEPRHARASRRQPLRRQQEAEPRPRAAPHPPAQLVKLRQAQLVGVLDQHDGRVRHVDPQLDDGGGDQDRRLTGGERAQRPLFGGRRPARRAAGQPGPAPARAPGGRGPPSAVTAPARRASSRTGQTTKACWPPPIASRRRSQAAARDAGVAQTTAGAV